jgi:hypothetical protein
MKVLDPISKPVVQKSDKIEGDKDKAAEKTQTLKMNRNLRTDD